MIRAYDTVLFDLVAGDLTLDEYVRTTTLASEQGAVRGLINRYMGRCQPMPLSRAVLEMILDEPVLLAKTRIVTEREWRNCVILLTPNAPMVTLGGITYADGSFDIDATLTYWRRHAETIFLQLLDSSADVTPNTLGENAQLLACWQFRRYFGSVLS